MQSLLALLTTMEGCPYLMPQSHQDVVVKVAACTAAKCFNKHHQSPAVDMTIR